MVKYLPNGVSSTFPYCTFCDWSRFNSPERRKKIILQGICMCRHPFYGFSQAISRYTLFLYRTSTPRWLLVRWFIIVGASLSEHCIADLMSWHTSHGICHHLLWAWKQYFVQPFLQSMKLLRLHTCFNYTSHWSYELNFLRLWVSI